MRLILLGPPGCGKGTQAKLLCRRNRLEHIGTGDLLREAIRKLTATGLRARPFVESGRLVPDEVVNDLIADRFRREDRPERFVLDGYPRTVAQARTFDGVLREHKLSLDARAVADRARRRDRPPAERPLELSQARVHGHLSHREQPAAKARHLR